jgi:transcriptional regulator with XRE-family HTH domain
LGVVTRRSTKDPRLLEKFGKRLRLWRVGSGLTGRQVYERLGIDKSVYSRLEAGTQEPTAEFLVGVRKEFGVSPTRLLIGDSGVEDMATGLSEEAAALLERVRSAPSWRRSLLEAFFSVLENSPRPPSDVSDLHEWLLVMARPIAETAAAASVAVAPELAARKALDDLDGRWAGWRRREQEREQRLLHDAHQAVEERSHEAPTRSPGRHGA